MRVWRYNKVFDMERKRDLINFMAICEFGNESGAIKRSFIVNKLKNLTLKKIMS